MKSRQIGAIIEESKHYKAANGTYPKSFLIGAFQLSMGNLATAVLPKKMRLNNQPPVKFVHGGESSYMYHEHAMSLQENLLRQLYQEPLPALLRYEDHNSMAWSVESRTPFMDYRLLEFTMGLPARYLLKNGVRKHILRAAMHGIIPEAIENRRDKMGFVTPEELWLKGEGKDWFNAEIDKACQQFGGKILDTEHTKSYVSEMMDGKRQFDFVPWRIICFNKWYDSVVSHKS